MSLCNIEFFDKNLNCTHHDMIQTPEIDDDYLAPEGTEIYISLTDNVSVRDFAWITGDFQFLGFVTNVATENFQTKVTVEPFISLFNSKILFHVTKQNQDSGSLETYIVNRINTYYTGNSNDSEDCYPCLNPSVASSTINWTLDLVKSDWDSYCACNMRDDVLDKAMLYYGVRVKGIPNFETKKIDVSVGTVSGYEIDTTNDVASRLNLSLDNSDVSVDSFSIDAASIDANVLTIYSKSSVSTKTTYFLHNDGRSPAYDKNNEARMLPIKRDMTSAEGTGSTFTTNATKRAKEYFKGLSWSGSLEIRVSPDDLLVNPKTLELGQGFKVWKNGTVYNMLLTGRKLGNEITLTFGSARTKLTKKIKVNNKKKK